MESLSKMLNIEMNYIGDPFTCNCGELVQIVELPIIGGPRKGELIQMNKGCKCEDRILAKEALSASKEQVHNKLKVYFNENSILNEDLIKATFQTFEPSRSISAEVAYQKAVEFVTNFEMDNPRNILFYGKPSQGKSHLSVSIIKELMKKSYTGLFISLPKLLTKIKSTYNKNCTVTEEEILKHLKNVDLLVLDDLGAEKDEISTSKSWLDSLLWQIVDDRQGKHTIYTSNLNDYGLEEYYNERTLKRLMYRTEKVVMKA